jgi:hypothetical protein
MSKPNPKTMNSSPIRPTSAFRTARSPLGVELSTSNVCSLLLLPLCLTDTLAQPSIIQQPQSQTNAVGGTATFTVAAQGVEPLTYQWQKMAGTWRDLVDRTNAALVLASVQLADDGDYRVLVADASDAVASDVVHLSVVIPPRITTQPTDFPVLGVGASITNRVYASGTTLAYEWRLNGNPLPGRTNSVLVLRDVQLTDAGDYTVLVSNWAGAVTSRVVALTVTLAPQMRPTIALQHTAVGLGRGASFTVTAFGWQPLGYQWRFDGRDLADQNGRTLTIESAQPSDEGDYSVVVTNAYGASVSEPARLLVVPPVSHLVKGSYTNAARQRLPYFYFVPPGYTPTQRYPLWCNFHGAGDYESVFLSRYTDVRLVGQSYGRQITDPAIMVWPVWRLEGDGWTDEYLGLTLGVLDRLITQFSIDTNRVYVGGGSAGGPGVWNILGKRPQFFAAAMLLDGPPGSYSHAAIKHVPLWAACANDGTFLSETRSFVAGLRAAGGNPNYTEYMYGGHVGGIFMALYTPVIFDWLNAQRRGVQSAGEPLLSITSPTPEPVYATGRTNLDLAGLAAAVGQAIIRVAWTNTANQTSGDAIGTNAWTVTGIPLLAGKTNRIIVTATTTSWAPGYGGNTTFNDTLVVAQAPLRATLTRQPPGATLTWTGGGPPYTVQRAADLAQSDWTDMLTDAVTPVNLPLAGNTGFYRVVGH